MRRSGHGIPDSEEKRRFTSLKEREKGRLLLLRKGEKGRKEAGSVYSTFQNTTRAEREMKR